MLENLPTTLPPDDPLYRFVHGAAESRRDRVAEQLRVATGHGLRECLRRADLVVLAVERSEVGLGLMGFEPVG